VTFAELLAAELRREPGRPLLTWYDERTGERVELSVTTYANWVAKTASLLVDEHDLERGDVLLLDLPAHWLGPVFLGAAWTAGLAVAFPPSASPAAVVCGPDGLDSWGPHADDVAVLACSLLPMGVRFAGPLPAGVHDVGVEVWGQPDAFVAHDPPAGGDVALVLPDGPVTQDELFGSSTAAGSSRTATGGGRLLSTANPASPPGVTATARALVSSASLVLVAGADAARLDEIAEAERVTGRHPA
jgi:uncharacterized protein (TIGR03089 family)